MANQQKQTRINPEYFSRGHDDWRLYCYCQDKPNPGDPNCVCDEEDEQDVFDSSLPSLAQEDLLLSSTDFSADDVAPESPPPRAEQVQASGRPSPTRTPHRPLMTSSPVSSQRLPRFTQHTSFAPSPIDSSAPSVPASMFTPTREGTPVAATLPQVHTITRSPTRRTPYPFPAPTPPTRRPPRDFTYTEDSAEELVDISLEADKSILQVYIDAKLTDQDIEQQIRNTSTHTESKIQKLMQVVQEMRTSQSRSPRQQDDEDEDVDVIDPGTAANILHADEQGIVLTHPPEVIFNYLYPQEQEAPAVPVSQIPGTGDVVPLEFSADEDEDTLLATRFLDALRGIEVPASPTEPQSSRRSLPVSLLPPETPAGSRGTPRTTPRRSLPPLHRTPPSPPLTLDEPRSPQRSIISSTPAPAPSLIGPPGGDESDFECVLELQAPKRQTLIQMRGSLPPPWFPGYYTVLPEKAHGIKLGNTPSAIIKEAWESTNPGDFLEIYVP